MKIVALLPLKANSERVKGKNFRNFCGKPLFRWMLDTLCKVDAIDSVVINTDARELLEDNKLIHQGKVVIRDRPEAICGDLVSMNLVIADDVDSVDADIYLMTHTTNPLLSIDSINTAIKSFIPALESGSADSLFSVNRVQTRFYDVNAKPINHDPENLLRTQDLEPWYEENSNLYLFTRDSFSQTQARIGKRPIMFETPPFESTDIDTADDWVLAEVMVKHFKQKGLL